MRLTPWRCDGEAGCRNLLRIINCAPWVIAAVLILLALIAAYELGRHA